MGDDSTKLASLLVDHDTSKTPDDLGKELEKKSDEKKDLCVEKKNPSDGETRIIELVKEAAEFGLF